MMSYTKDARTTGQSKHSTHYQSGDLAAGIECCKHGSCKPHSPLKDCYKSFSGHLHGIIMYYPCGRLHLPPRYPPPSPPVNSCIWVREGNVVSNQSSKSTNVKTRQSLRFSSGCFWLILWFLPATATWHGNMMKHVHIFIYMHISHLNSHFTIYILHHALPTHYLATVYDKSCNYTSRLYSHHGKPCLTSSGNWNERSTRPYRSWRNKRHESRVARWNAEPFHNFFSISRVQGLKCWNL